MLILRSFYFLHFVALGAFVPYLTIHFRDINLNNAQIGILVSILPLFITIAPTFWAQVADRTGRKKHLVMLACCCSALAFLMLGSMRQFVFVLGTLCLFGFFRSPVGALLEGVTFEQLKARGGDYGRIRMFGSFGFIIGVLLIGQLFERWGAQVIFFSVFLAGLGAASFASISPIQSVTDRDAKPPPMRALLGNRVLLIYLAAAFLMQLSHAGYNTFYSIYLDSLGVPRGVIGIAWSLGVSCEVGVLLSASRIVRRAGVQGLILMALAAALVRWTIFATVTNPLVLVAAQSLHGLTFGAFHVGSVMLVQSLVPDELRATGQSVFVSSSYGLGGIIGAWMVGFIASAYSIPAVFGVSVFIALASTGVFIAAVLPHLKNLYVIGVGQKV